ncbi:hypothetical protein [Apilactobacillus ozensis]|uniref:hypothetical protein n=1 Tax=Apilactobacillus ozensis TaxID=866801 RepID=UPI00200B978A|nr:hypothetical protein [Apilactobacillus ozensis]MCK8607216.1 hypothetical protein [Apilactobacillus ozensis]
MDMSDKRSYERTESLAIWNTPDVKNFESLGSDDKVNAFKKVYKPNFFDYDWLKDRNMNTVVVACNPGDLLPEGEMMNFHGPKSSQDARLASVLYGTKFWGSYMADLSSEVSSDIKKVKLDNSNVERFLKRIREIGIADDAPIIALGNKVFEVFCNYSGNKFNSSLFSVMLGKHQVKRVYHYSGANPHWKWDIVRKQITE